MLLSILGTQITRRRALQLFNLKRSNPTYSGAGHLHIGRVFAREQRVNRWRWDYHEVFDFASVAKSISAHMRNTALPTLLTFRIIHKNRKWKAKHVAVVIAATQDSIQLIDPLAATPGNGNCANVWLHKDATRKTIRVTGTSYNIDCRSETAVLRWSRERQT